MELKGNTILITGGGSGIGFALASRLAKNGNKVIICGRRAEQLAEAQKSCPELIPLQADISTAHGREELVSEIIQKYPDLNVVINNAGIQNRLPPLTEKQDWSKHEMEIATNLEAPMHLAMLFIPHLLGQRNPFIINVTSGLAFVPIYFLPTYCATKAALHSFTLTLRHQLKATPIKVVEIAPPAVNTDLGGKNLHNHGVDLNLFADHCMKHLEQGDEEFGYESSETRRLAVKQATDTIFKQMNP
ncbi:SDR family oxidoreductase [Bdellovibrio sp. NC01]|uniref:SDR family oxidoreductase n=1 Tax=Bdellovibrio sp. NC01 TaxID=2220073 RepID=UPI001158E218|nr:SDR family NAD(P)-dependent oxidoreductase [Bdellovibrio sp. NC01]QDK36385.1 short-chain dehydrogenase [Bdellovibrio sp. NC01]